MTHATNHANLTKMFKRVYKDTISQSYYSNFNIKGFVHTIVFSFATKVTVVMFELGFFLVADRPFFFLLFGTMSDFPSKYLPFYLIYHDFFYSTSWHHLSFSKFFPGEFRLTDTFLKTKLHILSLYILCILCYNKNKRHFEGA